jgi:hypothetical protein
MSTISTGTDLLCNANIQLCSLAQEDIRLCTIHRADADDTVGISLNYHRRERFHSLDITPGRNNGPSSKIIDS